VALGAAYSAARALVTMKHVGLNVAADPLFTAAYTGVSGALVVVTADDPGMASSQNEQDNRRYAVAAGLPMLSPADAQEACAAIRTRISAVHGDAAGSTVRILYGGSVKSDNMPAIMAEPDVDGALVGGASLDASEFVRICRYHDQRGAGSL